MAQIWLFTFGFRKYFMCLLSGNYSESHLICYQYFLESLDHSYLHARCKGAVDFGVETVTLRQNGDNTNELLINYIKYSNSTANVRF